VRKVWISKKKRQQLEKRIADLEKQIQSQQKIETELIMQYIIPLGNAAAATAGGIKIKYLRRNLRCLTQMSFYPKEKQGTVQSIWLCWKCAMQGRLPED